MAGARGSVERRLEGRAQRVERPLARKGFAEARARAAPACEIQYPIFRFYNAFRMQSSSGRMRSVNQPSGHAGSPLDELDRRIVAALQVDGRAAWRHIAEVLGESERSVTRRGNHLFAANRVRISTLGGHNAAVLVRAECAIASVRATATALAQRPDCVFAYALSGTPQCVAEIRVSTAHLPTLLLDELPAVVGLVRVQADPLLRSLRSVRQWRPAILTPVQVAALEAPPYGVQQPDGSEPPPSRQQTGRSRVRSRRTAGPASLRSHGRRGSASPPRGAASSGC